MPRKSKPLEKFPRGTPITKRMLSSKVQRRAYALFRREKAPADERAHAAILLGLFYDLRGKNEEAVGYFQAAAEIAGTVHPSLVGDAARYQICSHANAVRKEMRRTLDPFFQSIGEIEQCANKAEQAYAGDGEGRLLLFATLIRCELTCLFGRLAVNPGNTNQEILTRVGVLIALSTEAAALFHQLRAHGAPMSEHVIAHLGEQMAAARRATRLFEHEIVEVGGPAPGELTH